MSSTIKTWIHWSHNEIHFWIVSALNIFWDDGMNLCEKYSGLIGRDIYGCFSMSFNFGVFIDESDS